MTSIITGDIINSRSLNDQGLWLSQLKQCLEYLSKGDNRTYEIFRGDSFQIEVKDFLDSFEHAVYIKSCLKCIKGIDIRLAIGIGDKTFQGDKVSESNGEVFQYSGGTLELLKQEKTNLKIKTSHNNLNKELNLYFKLALIAMDNWTVNSAETVKLSLEHKNKLQKDLAQLLGINQEAVSKRLKRAYFEEIQELNRLFREKIAILIQ
ncbi:transcriptional regulator [Ichthyenterobacterium sp. W332]|uniref:Transcriptional regulator n=1 Tax=Microcosmobacter mediterraneus TaxID=3075607 RepID=A0ABU2YHQ2_9FLAO|nr:transcriptional regulator [Ichthyenterobacterium sp. W332]MDT0557671.1 transcriptional regulator [Ichthyenterobacterium sp. W332]